MLRGGVGSHPAGHGPVMALHHLFTPDRARRRLYYFQHRGSPVLDWAAAVAVTHHTSCTLAPRGQHRLSRTTPPCWALIITSFGGRASRRNRVAGGTYTRDRPLRTRPHVRVGRPGSFHCPFYLYDIPAAPEIEAGRLVPVKGEARVSRSSLTLESRPTLPLLQPESNSSIHRTELSTCGRRVTMGAEMRECGRRASLRGCLDGGVLAASGTCPPQHLGAVFLHAS